MHTRNTFIGALVIGATLAIAMGSPQTDPAYTSDFGLSGRTLVAHGRNAYLPLQPGRFTRLEGVEDGAHVALEISVLRTTRPVLFESDGQWMIAETRAMEEREWIDGELAQVAMVYLAVCRRSGQVFCFGEDVTSYEHGAERLETSWLAGRNGARPGLVMPGEFLIGSRYYQALAPGVTADRAENVEMGITIQTPAGTFQNCVAVLETGDAEDDEETLKVYAQGVGLVADGPLQIVEYH